jgi:1-acyl-sn-glycerol-3-phosphate acyltransferase
MKQVVDEGGSLCLFPCGDPAYGHIPNPISKQTVPLIRTLGVPVVLYTLHGGAGALPRWGDGRRKGPFIGRLERTLTPKEYADMSDAELYALINRTLTINDKPLGLTYGGNHRAERLERVLYVCPRCREHSVLYSQGNHISCRGCGMTANYTEAGNLVFLNCETPISTVDAWMDYQISWLQNHIDGFADEIYTDGGVTVLSVDRTPVDEPLFGTLSMTREKLLLRFEDGEAGTRTVGFALDSVAMLKPCGKTKLSLTTAQGTWEIAGAGGFCAYKYAQLFNALRGRFGK